jgi:hypothetical protein
VSGQDSMPHTGRTRLPVHTPRSRSAIDNGNRVTLHCVLKNVSVVATAIDVDASWSRVAYVMIRILSPSRNGRPKLRGISGEAPSCDALLSPARKSQRAGESGCRQRTRNTNTKQRVDTMHPRIAAAPSSDRSVLYPLARPRPPTRKRQHSLTSLWQMPPRGGISD